MGGVICRMMAAGSAFRVLSGQSDISTQNLEPLTDEILMASVKECLGAHATEKGVIDDIELRHMTSRTSSAIRQGRLVDITLERFVEMCSQSEKLSWEQVVDYFDRDHKRGLLEYIFDDTSAYR